MASITLRAIYLFFALLGLFSFAFVAVQSDNDKMTKCFNQTVCFQKDGKKLASACLNKLHNNDKALCLKLAGEYFHTVFPNMTGMVEHFCSNADRMEDAMNFYYREKDKEKEKLDMNQKRAEMQARGCMLDMVSTCV